MGQVLLEAGAMGRPVVATNHGGIADAIVHDRTGLLVGERDILALADALTIILEDQSLAQRLGAAARAYVEQDFNVFLQAEKVEALYRSALV
ncbi:glycosyl transferase family 1 [Paenarthrobacter nicotinovorans]|nr:glycosyl transferase family 1 [Paenarthrobacter nicotinovorans]